MIRDLVPSELRRQWTEAGYYPGVDAFRLFEEQAAAQPDAVAVIDDAGETTYADLASAARRVAQWLRAAGVQPGEVVGIQVPNSWQACAVDLAVAAVGAICMPYPVVFRERETTMLLGRSRAVTAVVAREFAGYDYAKMLDSLRPELPDLRHVFVLGEPYGDYSSLDPVLAGEEVSEDGWDTLAIDPNEPLRILVTSGTEAAPKMVLFSHNGVVGGIGNILNGLLPPGTGFRNLCLVPLSSGFGAIGTFATLARHGGTLIVTAAFQPDRALSLIEQHRPTHVLGVPTMLVMMLANPALATTDTSSLRVIATYGSAIPPETIEQIQTRFGCTFVYGYGCSDGAACETALDDPPQKVRTTVGRPDPSISTIRVVGPDGNDVPTGMEGEIWALGPLSPLCYFNAPELDQRYRDPEGWTKTGDLGVLDAEGYLRIAGRIKDIIIRGGFNISPAEAEELLLTHPAVLHVACVGMPDPRLGERMCAFLVLREGAEAPSLEEVQSFLLGKGLARTKLPERVEVIDEMPLSPTGKILKRALRDRIAAILEQDQIAST